MPRLQLKLQEWAVPINSTPMCQSTQSNRCQFRTINRMDKAHRHFLNPKMQMSTPVNHQLNTQNNPVEGKKNYTTCFRRRQGYHINDCKELKGTLTTITLLFTILTTQSLLRMEYYSQQ